MTIALVSEEIVSVLLKKHLDGWLALVSKGIVSVLLEKHLDG